MRTFLKELPVPISGLMLACFSLAKLSFDLYIVFTYIYFSIGLIIMFGLLGKLLFAFESVQQALKNPVAASITPTFPMGIMVMMSMTFSITKLAYIIWAVAIVLQIICMAYFIRTFLIGQTVNLQQVYPSWFVLFAGFGIIPTTVGELFPQFSQVLFIGAFAIYIILLPIVITRLITYRLKNSVMPLITIIGAPGSLCLVAYVHAFPIVNDYFLIGLLCMSQLFYILALCNVPRVVKRTFYPSFSALTFPLVISATAMLEMSHYFSSLTMYMFGMIEYFIAVGVVAFVAMKYGQYLFRKLYATI